MSQKLSLLMLTDKKCGGDVSLWFCVVPGTRDLGSDAALGHLRWLPFSVTWFIFNFRHWFILNFWFVSQIEKLRVCHDNSGRDPDWYLEEVTIDVPDKGEQYIFPCHRWLVGSQRDVDLVPGTLMNFLYSLFSARLH